MAATVVIVTNLPRSVTIEDIATIFHGLKYVSDSLRLEDHDLCAGYAVFTSLEEAKSCVGKLDGEYYDSRRMKVRVLAEIDTNLVNELKYQNFITENDIRSIQDYYGSKGHNGSNSVSNSNGNGNTSIRLIRHDDSNSVYPPPQSHRYLASKIDHSMKRTSNKHSILGKRSHNSTINDKSNVMASSHVYLCPIPFCLGKNDIYEVFSKFGKILVCDNNKKKEKKWIVNVV